MGGLIAIKGWVLIVESDTNLCRSIRNIMKRGGLEIHLVKSIDEAFNAFGQREYCLIILDFQEVNKNGLKAISMVRAEKKIPIIVMAKILQSNQKLELFQAGAHACIEKPVNVDECIAQTFALIQLYNDRVVYKQQHDLVFRAGLIIQPHFRQVLVDGEPLELTRKEFDSLYFLATNPGQVFSYEQLYIHVWKDNYTFCEDKTVKVHIRYASQKIEGLSKRLYPKCVGGWI